MERNYVTVTVCTYGCQTWRCWSSSVRRTSSTGRVSGFDWRVIDSAAASTIHWRWPRHLTRTLCQSMSAPSDHGPPTYANSSTPTCSPTPPTHRYESGVSRRTKSILNLLRRLLAWRCPHLLLSAVPRGAPSYWSISPAHRAFSNKPAARRCRSMGQRQWVIRLSHGGLVQHVQLVENPGPQNTRSTFVPSFTRYLSPSIPTTVSWFTSKIQLNGGANRASKIHRVMWRHRVYGHDTIAILWV